jgi:hypothetical protein
MPDEEVLSRASVFKLAGHECIHTLSYVVEIGTFLIAGHETTT